MAKSKKETKPAKEVTRTELQEMHENGLSDAEIAAKVGMSEEEAKRKRRRS